jgi:hypothetical protein
LDATLRVEFLAFPANIRLGRKEVIVANTPDYYNKELITAKNVYSVINMLLLQIRVKITYATKK